MGTKQQTLIHITLEEGYHLCENTNGVLFLLKYKFSPTVKQCGMCQDECCTHEILEFVQPTENHVLKYSLVRQQEGTLSIP